jgi:hypothetical protein
MSVVRLLRITSRIPGGNAGGSSSVRRICVAAAIRRFRDAWDNMLYIGARVGCGDEPPRTGPTWDQATFVPMVARIQRVEGRHLRFRA